MRILRWGLAILAVVALFYICLATLYPHEKIRDHPYFKLPEPWAIAHRGGRGLWPENTLFALERAQALGVDVLDIDLRTTSDGVLVVMHDATVDRTTNAHGRVDSMALAELRKLDAGFRFESGSGQFPFRARGIQVPMFEEVLTRFPETRINVEMKDFTSELAVKLCRMIEQHSATERVLAGSFPQDAMEAFRESCPSVATSATLRESLVLYQLHRMYLANIYRGPAVALQIPETIRGRRVLDTGLLQLSREYNLKVQVWTVNEEADMKRLLEMGVHAVLTDYPDRLLRLMGRKIDSPPDLIHE